MNRYSLLTLSGTFFIALLCTLVIKAGHPGLVLFLTFTGTFITHMMRDTRAMMAQEIILGKWVGFVRYTGAATGLAAMLVLNANDAALAAVGATVLVQLLASPLYAAFTNLPPIEQLRRLNITLPPNTLVG